MAAIDDVLLASAVGDPCIAASISNFGIRLNSMADLEPAPRGVDLWRIKQDIGSMKEHELEFAQRICTDENDAVVFYGVTQAVEGFLVRKRQLLSLKKQGAERIPKPEVLSRGPFWAREQFNDVLAKARGCQPTPLRNIWLYLDMSNYFTTADVRSIWNARTIPIRETSDTQTITKCFVYGKDGRAELPL